MSRSSETLGYMIHSILRRLRTRYMATDFWDPIEVSRHVAGCRRLGKIRAADICRNIKSLPQLQRPRLQWAFSRCFCHVHSSTYIIQVPRLLRVLTSRPAPLTVSSQLSFRLCPSRVSTFCRLLPQICMCFGAPAQAELKHTNHNTTQPPQIFRCCSNRRPLDEPPSRITPPPHQPPTLPLYQAPCSRRYSPRQCPLPPRALPVVLDPAEVEDGYHRMANTSRSPEAVAGAVTLPMSPTTMTIDLWWSQRLRKDLPGDIFIRTCIFLPFFRHSTLSILLYVWHVLNIYHAFPGYQTPPSSPFPPDFPLDFTPLSLPCIDCSESIKQLGTRGNFFVDSCRF